VLLYTTLNHIKYCLPNGDSGIIRTLDVPLYITRVSGNTIHALDRDGKARAVQVRQPPFCCDNAMWLPSCTVALVLCVWQAHAVQVRMCEELATCHVSCAMVCCIPLLDVPLYITRVSGNTIHALDRDGKARAVQVHMCDVCRVGCILCLAC
jgi:hypothetical protein